MVLANMVPPSLARADGHSFGLDSQHRIFGVVCDRQCFPGGLFGRSA
jgi:hypothetical protein